VTVTTTREAGSDQSNRADVAARVGRWRIEAPGSQRRRKRAFVNASRSRSASTATVLFAEML
jgi:hypothetical protein